MRRERTGLSEGVGIAVGWFMMLSERLLGDIQLLS